MARPAKLECECGTKLTKQNMVIVSGVTKICRSCNEKHKVALTLLPEKESKGVGYHSLRYKWKRVGDALVRSARDIQYGFEYAVDTRHKQVRELLAI